MNPSPLEQVANIYESSTPINSVSVSPDQKYILIGGRDGMYQIFRNLLLQYVVILAK